MSGCTGFFIVTVAESVERAYPVSAGNAEEAKRKVEGLISDGLIAPPSRLGKAASSISCTHVSESTEDACAERIGRTSAEHAKENLREQRKAGAIHHGCEKVPRPEDNRTRRAALVLRKRRAP